MRQVEWTQLSSVMARPNQKRYTGLNASNASNKNVSEYAAVPPLTLHLFDDFRLWREDVPVTSTERGRVQSLLTYLILHHDVPQSRIRLAYLLWPDSTDAQAHTNLRNLLHKLRNALPDIDSMLHVDRHSLIWHNDGSWSVDVLEFEGALARAEWAEQRQDNVAICSALEQAVALYQGDLLPDCYEEWILSERDRLFRLFLDALERLLYLWEQAGNYSKAIRVAHRLQCEDPLQEASYRHLMRLYAANGDMAAVVRSYRRCVSVLATELAVEPGPATRLIYERLVS